MENLEDWVCFILKTENYMPGEEGERSPRVYITVSQGDSVSCKNNSDCLCLQCSDYQNEKL